MRVLLTGATGFIGSFVLRRLLSEGMEVAILLRKGSDPWRIADLLSKARVINGGLEEIESALNQVRGFSPEAVCHLAWNGVAGKSRNKLCQVENLHHTIRLLKVAHQAGCRKWIAMGSQAEYGTWNRPINEDTPPRPTTMYGVVKLCTCMVCRNLCQHLGMRFVWLRLFSPYGPMDNPCWLIPYVILSLLQGQAPALTEGKQLWDYLYVADVAEAVYRAITSPRAEGIYNLGSGEARPVRAIVERIHSLIDSSLPLRFGEIPYRQDQVMHLQADISKIRDALDWSPRVGLEEGLKQTVEWFRANRWRYER